jgi:hypothetical protein
VNKYVEWVDVVDVFRHRLMSVSCV